MKGTAPKRDACAGFALIEIMLALVLVALLAALALPGLHRDPGTAALRVAALEVSALLREDRNAAQSGERVVSIAIQRRGRRVASGSSSAMVDMPAGAVARLLDSAAPGIRFFANGCSSGGSILIAADAARYLVTVNRDTGAIRVEEP